MSAHTPDSIRRLIVESLNKNATIANKHAVDRAIRDVCEQRDALLTACKWLLPIVEGALADWGNINAGGARQSIAKARAAITQAGGQP